MVHCACMQDYIYTCSQIKNLYTYIIIYILQLATTLKEASVIQYVCRQKCIHSSHCMQCVVICTYTILFKQCTPR